MCILCNAAILLKHFASICQHTLLKFKKTQIIFELLPQTVKRFVKTGSKQQIIYDIYFFLQSSSFLFFSGNVSTKIA